MSNQEKNSSFENRKHQSSDKANDSTPIYSTSNSTLQTPGEDRRDKINDPRQNEHLDVSNDDLQETRTGRMAGSDRAGTAERKDNQVENAG